MKRRELSAFTLRAIELTAGRAEFKDTSRNRPTWDGEMWHFGRLRHETHVLHEVAHWILSPWRALPNYGLGADPDGGKRTLSFLLTTSAREDVDAALAEIGLTEREIQGLDFEDLAAHVEGCLKERLTREEELAAMLTVFLTRFAGGNWMGVARTCSFFKLVQSEHSHLKFWMLAWEIARRGVDVHNPIPGLTGPAREGKPWSHLYELRSRKRPACFVTSAARGTRVDMVILDDPLREAARDPGGGDAGAAG